MNIDYIVNSQRVTAFFIKANSNTMFYYIVAELSDEMYFLLAFLFYKNTVMETEVWKTIDGFENYQISNTGKVKSIERKLFASIYDNAGYFTKPERILKTSINDRGYQHIGLRKSGDKKKYAFRIHRLVCKYFIPNQLDKEMVNHIDGNKLNNNASNLEWVTAKENAQHAIKIGLTNNRGEFNTSAKLTLKQVTEIREKYLTGNYSWRGLARMYRCTKTNIGYILKGKTWHAS